MIEAAFLLFAGEFAKYILLSKKFATQSRLLLRSVMIDAIQHSWKQAACEHTTQHLFSPE